jgi:rsbT co-antagonist protein RsbR
MPPDIAQLLQKKKNQIIDAWTKHQLADANFRSDLISGEELRSQSEEFVETLLTSLAAGDFTNIASPSLDPVIRQLTVISNDRVRQGYTSRETGMFVISLKEAMVEALQEELADEPDVLYGETVKINRLMDHLIISSFETFIKGREEVIQRQTDEISEISTPVIRIWDNILALPIIGTLDSARTQIVMESLLQQIVDTESEIAILDISGVPTVDSQVARHLLKTVNATRLMGAECIISGIRPEIAQTMVHLGVDLSGIVTKATLAGALQYSFHQLRLQVKKMT